MIDVLAFGAHPDDCEIFMGGSLLAFQRQGLKTAVCDLSMGEAGTYGTVEVREEEKKLASKLLKLKTRITLDLPDGNIRNTEENRLKIIEVIRKLRPELVFAFAPAQTRHPDHYHCGEMVRECRYLSGLSKIKTVSEPFRPSAFIAFPELVAHKKPDFVIDISEEREQKIEAIRAYNSQVTQKGEDDRHTKTLIRSNRFWKVLESRDSLAGFMIGQNYAEPFYSEFPPVINDIIGAFKKELL